MGSARKRFVSVSSCQSTSLECFLDLSVNFYLSSPNLPFFSLTQTLLDDTHCGNNTLVMELGILHFSLISRSDLKTLTKFNFYVHYAINKWFFQKNKKISRKSGGGLGTQKASLAVNKEETSHEDAFSTVRVPKHKHFNIYTFLKNPVHVCCLNRKCHPPPFFRHGLIMYP